MKALVTADLHLTSRLRDEYRWRFLDWVTEQRNLYEFTDIFILGDITDRKDEHPAELVNRFLAHTKRWQGAGTSVTVLMGNHDYIDPTQPFFGFMDGQYGTFVSEPQVYENVLLLPHSKQFIKAYGHHLLRPGYDYIFAHQPVEGAAGTAGYKMAGVPRSIFNNVGNARVISGDIHMPQKVGNVEYVGAPYHVNFGDAFVPRVLLIDGSKVTNLYPPGPKKVQLSVGSLDGLQEAIDKEVVSPNDHVRILYSLHRSLFDEWDVHKQAAVHFCEHHQLVLYGIELKVKERPKMVDKAALVQPETNTRLAQYESFCDGRPDIDEGIRAVGRELVTENEAAAS